LNNKSSKKKTESKEPQQDEEECTEQDVTDESNNQETKGKPDPKYTGIPSLEILNSIIEVLNMDFNNITGDIIEKDTRRTYWTDSEKFPKPRMTKKAKDEEFQHQKELRTLIPNINSETDIAKEYIKIASKLTDSNIKLPENKQNLENGIKAALQLASFYDSGEKLVMSGVKANMIYIYLIKKFNSPEAMFMLGQNLLVGNFIIKNFLHGAKLIKVAAEKYKYKNAIAKLKSMTRIDNVTRVTIQNQKKQIDDDLSDE
jgi:hypothetical protein